MSRLHDLVVSLDCSLNCTLCKLKSVQSDHIAVKMFNSLNKNLFNYLLDGIYLKWITNLKNRTAITLILGNEFYSNVIIGLSGTLIGSCNRKQILETLLYEMILLFIVKTQLGNSFSQAFLQRAIEYVNKAFDTNLTYNYTFYAHKITPRINQWIYLEDDVRINELNDTLICIDDSDGEDDQGECSDTFQNMKVLTKKIKILPLHLNYNLNYEEFFKKTNFKLVLGSEPLNILCPLCKADLRNSILLAHLNSCAIIGDDGFGS